MCLEILVFPSEYGKGRSVKRQSNLPVNINCVKTGVEYFLLAEMKHRNIELALRNVWLVQSIETFSCFIAIKCQNLKSTSSATYTCIQLHLKGASGLKWKLQNYRIDWVGKSPDLPSLQWAGQCVLKWTHSQFLLLTDLSTHSEEVVKNWSSEITVWEYLFH